MSYQLDKLEKDILKQLLKNNNLKPLVKRLDELLDKNDPESYIVAFNKIHNVIQNANDDVQKMLDAEEKKRQKEGKTYDVRIQVGG